MFELDTRNQVRETGYFGGAVRLQINRAMPQSLLQVPGDIDHHDALISPHQQKQLEQLSPLVVERRLPPVFDHQLGDQDGDLTIRVVMLDFQDVLDEGHDDKAVRRG
jgi:hypothetical protein